MVSISSILNRAILTELAGVGGELETLTLRLFTAGPALSPDAVWADFTEATFTGYAGEALTWLNPETQSGDASVLPSQLVQFECTGTAVTETVLGWVVTSGAGPVLFRFGNTFAAPVPFDGVGATLTMAVQFGLLGSSELDALILG